MAHSLNADGTARTVLLGVPSYHSCSLSCNNASAPGLLLLQPCQVFHVWIAWADVGYHPSHTRRLSSREASDVSLFWSRFPAPTLNHPAPSHLIRDEVGFSGDLHAIRVKSVKIWFLPFFEMVNASAGSQNDIPSIFRLFMTTKPTIRACCGSCGSFSQPCIHY